MIPAAANIPLTICSVVIRRFIDSYTGRLPLAVTSSTVPTTASTVALFSGALFCLYHQLRKGTLVQIGMGRRLTSMLKNSRHTIQRRVKNNSWFLRNLAACRRKCTEAMFRIASQSNDSLQNIQAETGTIVETNSLPSFTRYNVEQNRRNVKHEPPLENLYSNESFDSNDCSNQDLRVDRLKQRKQALGSKRRSLNHTPHRPVTRNFRKSIPGDASEDSRNRLSPRKRKKSEHVVNEPEDLLLPVTKIHSEARRNYPRRQSRISDKIAEPGLSLKSLSRRHSGRITTQPKFQKITRKTRSGRVYAYRL